MSLGNICRAIQETPFFTGIRESGMLYPVLLSSHLATLAVFGGMILITDLRLLGLAFTNIPVSEVVLRTRPWKRLGFVLMITWGIMLAGSKLSEYYDNPYFDTKLLLLLLVGVHALVFRASVYRNPQRLDKSVRLPAVAKVAACTSLALWLGIMSMGRWIAYYDRPEYHPHRVERPAAP